MRNIAIIGLGYVGLSLAIEFGHSMTVLGYDCSEARVDELRNGLDSNRLFSKKQLLNPKLRYYSDLAEIAVADFYIVTVPTPAYYYDYPNIEPLQAVSRDLAKILKVNDIVVYESTVYPGLTEEICIPLLEEGSGLQSAQDFFVGYSPERVNIGDDLHTIRNTPKIISAQTKEALAIVSQVYALICESLHPVSNLKTAEAIKILENTQRDVNIALMNEFIQITHALGLDTHEILEGAKTKWSFVPFRPGLVGGHCISVDPQYLAFKAQREGVLPRVIRAAREVNNAMPEFIIKSMFKYLLLKPFDVKATRIGIFGVAFKENISDYRNSLALKLIRDLKQYGFQLVIHDSKVDKAALKNSHGIVLTELEDIRDLDVAVVTVGHKEYIDNGLQAFQNHCSSNALIMDIPHCFSLEAKQQPMLQYWSL